MRLPSFLKDLLARRVMERGDISDQDIVIIVIGPTGAGKSSFINTATKSSEVVISHGLASCTGEVVGVKCIYPGDERGRSVVFVDTPAFNHDAKAVTEIGKSIMKWQKIHARKCKVAGILYMHRISDIRITESPLAHFMMFQKSCGTDFQEIVLVTTMWSKGDREKAINREEEIRTRHWKSMMDLGSRMIRFEDTTESAWEAVNLLLGGR